MNSRIDEAPGGHAARPSGRRSPPWRALGWVLAVLAALAVFTAYLDPTLMMTLGNAIWSCF